jgi:hypothetical protein
MSTMVERVGQTLEQEIGTAPLDEPASSFALARAAIAAMREPTEEMLDAPSPPILFGFALHRRRIRVFDLHPMGRADPGQSALLRTNSLAPAHRVKMIRTPIAI